MTNQNIQICLLFKTIWGEITSFRLTIDLVLVKVGYSFATEIRPCSQQVTGVNVLLLALRLISMLQLSCGTLSLVSYLATSHPKAVLMAVSYPQSKHVDCASFSRVLVPGLSYPRRMQRALGCPCGNWMTLGYLKVGMMVEI